MLINALPIKERDLVLKYCFDNNKRVYFVPTIATSVYQVLDRTLIGLITHEENQNGFYEQANKIINLIKIVEILLTYLFLFDLIGFLIVKILLFVNILMNKNQFELNFNLEGIIRVNL